VSTFVDRGVSRGQRGGSPTVVNLSTSVITIPFNASHHQDIQPLNFMKYHQLIYEVSTLFSENWWLVQILAKLLTNLPDVFPFFYSASSRKYQSKYLEINHNILISDPNQHTTYDLYSYLAV
jgi:hypothetical protein